MILIRFCLYYVPLTECPIPFRSFRLTFTHSSRPQSSLSFRNNGVPTCLFPSFRSWNLLTVDGDLDREFRLFPPLFMGTRRRGGGLRKTTEGNRLESIFSRRYSWSFYVGLYVLSHSSSLSFLTSGERGPLPCRNERLLEGVPPESIGSPRVITYLGTPKP